MRVPEYGWTTQKVFHFLNFLVNGVRALVFVFGRSVQNLHPEIAVWLILWWKYIPLLVILSKMFFAGLSLFAAFGFLLYGGRDDEDDSVAKMKAAEEALEAKQKVTNSLSATCSFFLSCFIIL
ncbi:hypothetical protein V6Z11_D07G190400 [Gossypium hirsutum]|uniref:Tobamovirus multiplication protein 3-like isoform X1 n=1 Tax=Gossypium hirsutum TaxID=3635 RepID=A0A1U8N4H0_GOSHI|nr:tobamovirus multiplication protein 3-like isoform X1 [Gossypium hirsutum]XP_016733998.1 tobamovirus multiplication protein 3-like isoform X1 [Gossypium hirsutum]